MKPKELVPEHLHDAYEWMYGFGELHCISEHITNAEQYCEYMAAQWIFDESDPTGPVTAEQLLELHEELYEPQADDEYYEYNCRDFL